jgi:hypothetical protein
MTPRQQLSQHPAHLLSRQERHLFFPTPAASSARTHRPVSSAPCGDATLASFAPHTHPTPPRSSQSATPSQSAKYTTPERANLTASARVPIIGLAGLLNLLDVVEKIQASHASLRDGGESPCPTKLPLVSPPAPERPATTTLGTTSPTQPQPAPLAVESVAGTSPDPGPIAPRGGHP